MDGILPDQAGVYKYKVDFPGTFCQQETTMTEKSIQPSRRRSGYKELVQSTLAQPTINPTPAQNTHSPYKRTWFGLGPQRNSNRLLDTTT